MKTRYLLPALIAFLTSEGISAQSAIYAPRSPTPQEQAKFVTADKAMTEWSHAAKARHLLEDAGCSALNGVACSFSIDGVTLKLFKKLGGGKDLQAFLSIGNRIQVAGNQIQVVGGKWIKAGDVLELESGSKLFPYVCLPMGDGKNSFAQCRAAFNLAEITGRSRITKSRYVSEFEGPQLGRVIASADLKVRHNDRLIRWPNLIAAARQFKQQDFSKVIPN